MLYNIHHHKQLANASLAASPQKKPALVRQLAGKDDLSSPWWWRGARPSFHSTWIGGWWRRMRAITRDFRNPGRRCCAERLGGRVVVAPAAAVADKRWHGEESQRIFEIL